ncbi:hypothetical protein LBW56_20340, partial [Ralstonia solanacearum]|nr:hypothetical protein [Ralstonia solanacearum]MDB0552500.1 hypothetical protein [Ralstonia solanacearum]
MTVAESLPFFLSFVFHLRLSKGGRVVMKKFAYATGLLLLTGVAAGMGQTALAQTTPAAEAPAAASAPAS